MSTIRANAILDSAGGNTATINGIPFRPGILDPENRVINGAFDLWQRGTSFSGSSYNADRWRIFRTGEGTTTVSRQNFALGTTLGTNNPKYYLSASTSNEQACSFYQQVEDVRSYAGQTVTILGWARRSAGSGNVLVRTSQDFGSGGSPSAVVYSAAQTITLTSSFTPFAAVVSVASITGKTLGTGGNDNLVVEFLLSASGTTIGVQTITVDLWGIHIKVGTHTTAAADLYKAPEFQSELARCQRYYTTGVTVVPAGGVAAYMTFFPTTMRRAPTVSGLGTGAAANIAANGFFANQTTASAQNFIADAEF